MEPTLVESVPAGSNWLEEIFGPVTVLSKFRTEHEAVEMINTSAYNLAPYIFTGEVARALSLARKMETGTVGVNETAIDLAEAPFCGFGREGTRHGILEYFQVKYLNCKLNNIHNKDFGYA